MGYRAVRLDKVATAGSRLGNPCAGFCEFRVATAEREKTVVALALALAVTVEEIIFSNREPTGDKTNLISAKVHQLDSFLASALFFVAFVRWAEQQKKTINPRVSLKEPFSLDFRWQVFIGAAFHLFPNKQTKAQNFED